ncbi:unnamed protein product [Peronospora belbahrii]|uniref:Uncharacterized protein n=1 Tax=Peronospora belbahrii TaxID=622444 RepID=A0ABN8D8L8_9STRA|nr:unnamed protein product [Peronospora belbahrii]
MEVNFKGDQAEGIMWSKVDDQALTRLMQVEDPSSRFVDFSNATDLEQYILDIEQALIGWHLDNKGLASLETLNGIFAKRLRPQKRRQAAALDATVWVKKLQHQLPGTKMRNGYTLTLFVARHHGTQQNEEPNASV